MTREEIDAERKMLAQYYHPGSWVYAVKFEFYVELLDAAERDLSASERLAERDQRIAELKTRIAELQSRLP